MYAIEFIRDKQHFFICRAICQEFCDEINKALDWTHCFNAVGNLIDAKMVECLVLKQNHNVVGILGWVYFPDLISNEFSATELAWYVSKNHRGWQGFKLLKKMIDICKKKNVININMAHFPKDKDVAKIYKRLGFKPAEIFYSLRVA
jgi:GNAT superfamily N-acetyltransferase